MEFIRCAHRKYKFEFYEIWKIVKETLLNTNIGNMIRKFEIKLSLKRLLHALECQNIYTECVIHMTFVAKQCFCELSKRDDILIRIWINTYFSRKLLLKKSLNGAKPVEILICKLFIIQFHFIW